MKILPALLLVVYIIMFLNFIWVPLVICYVFYWWLHPITFWETLATLIFSIFLYAGLFGFLLILTKAVTDG
jgi:hypothetical protein